MTEPEPRPRIRPARAGDVEALADIQRESFQQAYSGILDAAYLAGMDRLRLIRTWESKLAACGLFGGPVREALFVGETEAHQPATLLGFVEVGGSRSRLEPFAGEVYMLYVLPRAQGQGLGRRLMDIAARQLQSRGYPVVLVQVLEQNARARRFYERWGMQQLPLTTSLWIGGRAQPVVTYRRRL